MIVDFVELSNWRAYRKVVLEPQPGVNFLVAHNGVGKTSIILGAQWALFGPRAGIDPAGFLRHGTDHLATRIEVTVGDHRIAIARRWSPGSRPRLKTSVTVDGIQAKEDDLGALLASQFAISPDAAARLVFVPESTLAREASMFQDIHAHLRHLVGVEGLERAAETANRAAGRLAKELREQKRRDAVDSNRRDELEQRLASAESEHRVETTAIEQLSAAHASARQRQHELRVWSDYEEAHARWSKEHSSIKAELTALDVEDLGEDRAHANTHLDNLNTETAELRAGMQLARDLREQFNEAGAECPVCRQPISEARRHHASEHHNNRMKALVKAERELQERVDVVAARSRTLNRIHERLRELEAPTPPATARPPDSDDEPEELANALHVARQRRDTLVGQISEIRTQLDGMSTADGQEDFLANLHAKYSAAEALAGVANEIAAERVRAQLDPFLDAIHSGWRQFFTDRGELTLSSSGALELIDAEGNITPFGSFSGGEKVLAVLAARLVYVAAATDVSTMWIDEPLEHLDLRNRQRSARLLATVAANDPRLSQIVVTTYEAEIADVVASRHDNVSVIPITSTAVY